MWRSGRIPCQGPTLSAGVCYAGVEAAVGAASTLGLSSYGEPPSLGHDGTPSELTYTLSLLKSADKTWTH